MMKSLLTIGAAAAILQTAAAEPILKFDGQLTDRTPGWKFVASNPRNGMTFNQFEGYYPDKGGKLISPRIKLQKPGNKAAYYRITFDAESKSRAYQAVNFYDQKGTLLPDHYDVIYAGKKRHYDRVFYTMDNVDSIEVFFQSNTGVRVWNLTLEPATPEDAAKYCDDIYSRLPPIQFQAPANAFDLLPKTRAALNDGRPFRVVMLGDSIMQDTFHSQFHSLLKREFPNSNFSFIISMRGSTGCWHYQLAEPFKRYVIDQKPDLLIIGGISNYLDRGKPTGDAAIEQVIRAAKAFLDCEILIQTAPLSKDTRAHVNEPDAIPSSKWIYENDGFVKQSYHQSSLADVAKRCNVALWDVTTPGYQWLYDSGKSFEFYSRDNVHSGELGKQIIGRIVLEYFKTAKVQK